MSSPGIKRAWRTVAIPNPAVGADWSLEPGGQRYFRITSLVAVLSTGAAAPQRQVLLTAERGGRVWFRQPAVAGIGAAAAVAVAAFTGAPRDGSFINTLTIPLPAGGLLLRPGDRLAVVTGSLDAADQWSAIVVELEEIPSGADYEGDQLTTPTENE